MQLKDSERIDDLQLKALKLYKILMVFVLV